MAVAAEISTHPVASAVALSWLYFMPCHLWGWDQKPAFRCYELGSPPEEMKSIISCRSGHSKRIESARVSLDECQKEDACIDNGR